MSGTLDQLKQVNQATRDKAAGRGEADAETEKLPQGASPLEASAETPEVEEATAEAPEAEEEAATAEAGASGAADEEELIRIGDQEFKTQAEAIAYAKKLQEEKIINEAYSRGVQEALQAQGQQGAAPQPEPEDNFEEQFYTDPKKALAEVQKKAVQEALKQVEAQRTADRMWSDFLEKYPDVRRKDAERVLRENWNTIGKITDEAKGMALLASKVREEYEEIIERAKPRTELSNKKGQVTGPKGSPAPSVTPQKKDNKPLDFASQVRTLKKQG